MGVGRDYLVSPGKFLLHVNRYVVFVTENFL